MKIGIPDAFESEPRTGSKGGIDKLEKAES
jgi:hypothetical protein